MKKEQIMILKKIGLKPSKKNLEKLDGENLYKYNTLMQKLKGKKEFDYFSIIEYGISSEDIFEKYKNIKEWDLENYLFQKEHETMVRDEYDSLYLSATLFRAIEKQEFSDNKELIYGNLESARSYIFEKIYRKLEKEIQNKYPYIYVQSYKEPTFKKIKGKKLYEMADTELRAGGKEKELSDIKKRLRELYNNIEDDIVFELNKFSGYTFKKYGKGSRFDRLDTFIVGGFEAAENISFKTFFNDFYLRLQPIELLKKPTKKILKKYKKILFSKKDISNNIL